MSADSDTLDGAEGAAGALAPHRNFSGHNADGSREQIRQRGRIAPAGNRNGLLEFSAALPDSGAEELRQDGAGWHPADVAASAASALAVPFIRDDDARHAHSSGFSSAGRERRRPRLSQVFRSPAHLPVAHSGSQVSQIRRHYPAQRILQTRIPHSGFR